MKKILVIGAGWEQLELIKEIRNHGHKIIATHPHLDTEVMNFVDVYFVKDSRDIDAHLEIAQTHQVDAIVTDNCDYSFYTASIVSKKLNLSFAPIKSAIYANNKFAQRMACDTLNIQQPKYFLVETLEEIQEAAEKLAFPLVVKPIDSRGTFGVTIVSDIKNLDSAFFDAIINSPSRRVICEKFIEGTLVTVDGFCFSNGHKALAVASRSFEKGQKPVTKEIIYPAIFEKSLKQALLRNHENVVKALDYNYGHTHGEYIVDANDDIYLVECTNRGGGVYTSSTILPSLSGFNLNEILLNQSLGIDTFEVEKSEDGFMQKSVMLTFLDFEVGKVIKSINHETIRELDYVLKYKTIYGEKDMVESIENCASRHSMLVIEGKDVKETYANLENFKSIIKVEYYNL